MTLGQKYLVYAKNICELKKGYNLENARKYFGKDYSNFVVFYMTFREAKETVRHNKEALTVRQMQYVGALVKKLFDLYVQYEATRRRAENLQGVIDYAGSLVNEQGLNIKSAKAYHGIFKTLTRSVAEDAYSFYTTNLEDMFKNTFEGFVNTYYTFNEETKTFYLKEDKYVEQVSKEVYKLGDYARKVISSIHEENDAIERERKRLNTLMDETIGEYRKAEKDLQDLIGATFEVPL